MRHIPGFIICLALDSFIHGLFLGTELPSLMLLFVVFAGIKDGERIGIIWGFIAGFMRALVLYEPIALECIELIIIGYLSGALGRRVVLVRPMARVAAVFILYLIGRGLSGLLYKIIAAGPIDVSLTQGLLNVVCSLVLFYLLERLYYKRRPRIYMTQSRDF